MTGASARISTCRRSCLATGRTTRTTSRRGSDFAYSINDRTVLRGGYGMFYAQETADEVHQTTLFIIGVSPTNSYDGRPDWPTNPWNGPEPTFDQVMASACDLTNNRPGCLRRQFLPEINDARLRHAVQPSGVGRRAAAARNRHGLRDERGLHGRPERRGHSENINLTYNPATGANYPSSGCRRRAFPLFGPVQMALFGGRSNYDAWENSLTKRLTDRWQAT